MDKKEKRYDAFISYRHNDIDKFVAENLHRLLESYKIPKSVVSKYNLESNRIKRVFRDQEELPTAANLESSIANAIADSKFLIVICSPRLKHSIWCQQEIESFIEQNGRSKVVCVLVEGEPSESFPEQLLYEEVEEKGKIVKKIIEPLAADVRGTSKKEIKKKLKEELLRVIAAMLGVYYDDLKQRHQQRKNKRITMIVGSIIAMLSLFTIYSSIMLYTIYNQNYKIMVQQAKMLSNEALDYLKDDNRIAAIETSKEAFSLNKNINVSDAQYALTESLGVYDINTYKAQYQFDTLGVVNSIKVNDSTTYMLSYDLSQQLILWNIENRDKVIVLDDIIESRNNKFTYAFIDDNTFAYITEDSVKVYDIKGKQVNEFKIKGANSIACNESYLAIRKYDLIELYDLNNNKLLYSYTTDIGRIANEIYINDNYLLFGEVNSIFNETNNNGIRFKIFNIDTKDVKNINVDSELITEVVFKNNIAYVLSNSGEYDNIKCNILAIDLNKGKVLWNQLLKGEWGEHIQKSFADNANTLMVSTVTSAYIFNEETGNKLNNFSIGESTVKIFASLDNDMYLTFGYSGTVRYIYPDSDEVVVFMDKYELNKKYTYLLSTNYGFLALLENENRIVMYDIYDNKDSKEIDYKDSKKDTISSEDRDTIIDKLDLKKKNLVDSIIKKDNIIYIRYTDNSLEVYKDYKLVNIVYDVIDGMDYYLGKDKNGNIYLAGTEYGYILNKNYEKIAKVHYLVDLDGDSIIVKSYGKYYKLPIYSLKELLDMKY